jgi:hypothetical protein
VEQSFEYIEVLSANLSAVDHVEELKEDEDVENVCEMLLHVQ